MNDDVSKSLLRVGQWLASLSFIPFSLLLPSQLEATDVSYVLSSLSRLFPSCMVFCFGNEEIRRYGFEEPQKADIRVGCIAQLDTVHFCGRHKSMTHEEPAETGRKGLCKGAKETCTSMHAPWLITCNRAVHGMTKQGAIPSGLQGANDRHDTSCIWIQLGRDSRLAQNCLPM